MTNTKGKNIGPMTHEDSTFYACLSSFLSAIFVDEEAVEDLVSDIISRPERGAYNFYSLADFIIRNLYKHKAWPTPLKNEVKNETTNVRVGIVNRLVPIIVVAVCCDRISNNIEIKLDQNVLKSLVTIYDLKKDFDEVGHVKTINIVF